MKQRVEAVAQAAAQGGTWWFDPEDETLWWSSGIYELHGVDPDTYTPDAQSMFSFLATDSQRRLRAALDKAVAEHTGWQLTLSSQASDGSNRVVYSQARAEKREGRRPLLTGVLIAREPAAADSAGPDRPWRQPGLDRPSRGRPPDQCVLEIDFDRGYTRLSGGLVDRLELGDTGQAAIALDRWQALIHPDDYPLRCQRLDAHLAGRTAWYVSEYRLCLPHTVRWVAEAGCRVADTDAGARLLGTLTDVSADNGQRVDAAPDAQQLRQMLAEAPIGAALAHADGRMIRANRALCELLGYTETELLGQTLAEHTISADRHAEAAARADVLAGRTDSARENRRYRHKQGYVVETQTDTSGVHDALGTPLYVCSYIQDISAARQAEHALDEVEELVHRTFEAIGEGVLQVDRQGCITAVNSAACTLLGWAEDELMGRRFDETLTFHESASDKRLPDPAARVLEYGRQVRMPLFSRLRRADGSYISITDSLSPLHDHGGNIRGAIFVFRDMSEAHRMTDQLAHQASHDELTGLPNRRGFDAALNRTWQRVGAGAAQAYVIYLDLDHFKTVNDTCGHTAGDELLRQIGDIFRTLLTGDDVLARIGGDEFAAIVHSAELAAVEDVARRFVGAVRDLNFTHRGRTYAVGVSLGIAELTPALDSIETGLIHADAALYVAKDTGRGRYHIYGADSAHEARAAEFVNIARVLHRGLEQNHFTLYLQQIVDQQGRRCGYEALLRFVDPDQILLPDAFLPTAERLGMMSRIDYWVVDEALRLLRTHRDAGTWPADCYLSINVSPVSLGDPEFHARLIALLEQHQAETDLIRFEITETAALFGQHYPRLIGNLRQRGCRIWLDDFASGYNGFDMLKRVSVDGIKMDRSFVADADRDLIDRTVKRSVGDVSDALSLGVIAEGVESAAAFELLVDAGFTHFQGFLFHSPEPVAAALGRPPAVTRV